MTRPLRLQQTIRTLEAERNGAMEEAAKLEEFVSAQSAEVQRLMRDKRAMQESKLILKKQLEDQLTEAVTRLTGEKNELARKFSKVHNLDIELAEVQEERKRMQRDHQKLRERYQADLDSVARHNTMLKQTVERLRQQLDDARSQHNDRRPSKPLPSVLAASKAQHPAAALSRPETIELSSSPPRHSALPPQAFAPRKRKQPTAKFLDMQPPGKKSIPFRSISDGMGGLGRQFKIN
ncbi:hypothetical protein RI367_003133 [Sorochytrium milnesiophthora]